MSTMPVEPEEIHRLSIDDYHRLIESGGLEDARVELIDGLVVDMSPKSPQHEDAIAWLVRWLRIALDVEAFDMFVTRPLTFETSEPEPDITVVSRWSPRNGDSAHPSSALLVIEVAHSSRSRDLGTKPLVYAPHVAEYWVVDLDRRCVVVHRDPDGETYRSVTIVADGESLAPKSVTISEIDTAALFAAAFREGA